MQAAVVISHSLPFSLTGGTRVALTVIQAPTSTAAVNNDTDVIAPVSPSSTLRLDSNTPSPRHHRVTAPQPPNVSGFLPKHWLIRKIRNVENVTVTVLLTLL